MKSFHKKTIVLLALLGLTVSLRAQTPWTARSKGTWRFGHGAVVTFDASGTPTPSVNTVTTMNQYEGVASVSDRCSGDLLFYTEGTDVRDASDAIMPNGTTISTVPTYSATQGTLIVPMGSDPNKYIVFSVSDIAESGLPYRTMSHPTTVQYSIVDMTLPGNGSVSSPSGDVVVKQQPLYDYDGNLLQGVTEKITAVKAANGQDYWVIIHKAYDNTTTPPQTVGSIAACNRFLVYKVSLAGICTTPTLYDMGVKFNYFTNMTSGSGCSISWSAYWAYNGDCLGYLKPSPDGTMLGMATRGENTIEIFNFNTTTGAITVKNGTSVPFSGVPIVINSSVPNYVTLPYGISFDKTSTYLYAGECDNSLSEITQFAVANGGYINSHNVLNAGGSSSNQLGAIQLAPDGNLYYTYMDINPSCVMGNFGNRLGRIDNSWSSSSTYNDNALSYTGNRIALGLPNMIDNDAPVCITSNCFALSLELASGAFTTQSSNVTTNTVWSGKQYVTSTIHVTNNSNLDLTNVDVVFAQGVSIIVDAGSSITGLNSVFRICDAEFWGGFQFSDGSRGTFEGCQFINAAAAINPLGAASVKVTNNLFRNCRYGVLLGAAGDPNSDYTESISGNTFERNTQIMQYYTGSSTCGTISYTSDYYGIYNNSRNVQQKIAQNNFRFTGNPATMQFYGIYFTNGSGIISENNFTNMYRGIDIFQVNGYTSIENNNIELNANGTGTPAAYNDMYQIVVNNNPAITTSPVLIYSNTITNNIPASVNFLYAIYTDNGSNISISQNKIKGFDYAIRCGSGSSNVINENTIEDGRRTGIYQYNNNNITITNNVIRMTTDMTTSSPAIQTIGIQMDMPLIVSTASTSVSSNCIFNCYYAVNMLGNPSITFQPFMFTNNYMYNYTGFGVFIANFAPVPTPAIGTGATFGTAGHNSFISNYKPAFGTIRDINYIGGPSFNDFGDFFNGAATVSAGVTVTASNVFSSISACGQQVHRQTAPPAGIAAFQAFVETHYPLTFNGTAFSLNDTAAAWVKAAPAMVRYENALSVMDILAHGVNKDGVLELFYNSIINAFSGNENLWLTYSYDLYMNDVKAAANVLGKITPENDDEADRVKIEGIRIRHYLAQTPISDAEIMLLTSIDNKRGKYAASARQIVDEAIGDHDYIFKKPEMPVIPSQLPKMEIYRTDEICLDAYPNPSAGRISVKYDAMSVKNARIAVYNMEGQSVMEMPLKYTSTQFTVDLSNLKDGQYLMTLEDESGVLKTTKLLIHK